MQASHLETERDRSSIAVLEIRERHSIHGLVILGTLLLRRVREGLDSLSLPSSSTVFMKE